MNPTKTLQDNHGFTLNKTDLTKKTLGHEIETRKRDIPCSDGLQWYIQWYPAGDRETAKNHVSVFVLVNKPVKAKFGFSIDGSSISLSATNQFTRPSLSWGWSKFASHEDLYPLFRSGKLYIKCDIEFYLPMSLSCLKPSVFQSCDHFATDLELVMESQKVQAHKSFLSLISPVFHAMFTHDTKEARSHKVDITDFDYATVKDAIDFCYGRQLECSSMETVVGILRFADKYNIKSVTTQLDKLPFSNLSKDTFCTIVHYAYDCSQNELLAECCKYFKLHQNEIKDMEQFAKLPPSLVVDVIKSAFDLNTIFDVLCHAHKNGITFVVDHLEQPLLASMTLNDFCVAVCYAWECSRDALKKVCAQFWNGNKDNATCLPEFHELPPETISGLLKLGFQIKKAEP